VLFFSPSFSFPPLPPETFTLTSPCGGLAELALILFVSILSLYVCFCAYPTNFFWNLCEVFPSPQWYLSVTRAALAELLVTFFIFGFFPFVSPTRSHDGFSLSFFCGTTPILGCNTVPFPFPREPLLQHVLVCVFSFVFFPSLIAVGGFLFAPFVVPLWSLLP